LVEVQIELSGREAVALSLPFNPYGAEYVQSQLRRGPDFGIQIAALQNLPAQPCRYEPKGMRNVDVLQPARASTATRIKAHGFGIQAGK